MTTNHTAPAHEPEGELLLIIDRIQRSVEALSAMRESWPWTGQPPIAEMSHLAILIRKYPQEARKVLAELETAGGNQPVAVPVPVGGARDAGPRPTPVIDGGEVVYRRVPALTEVSRAAESQQRKHPGRPAPADARGSPAAFR